MSLTPACAVYPHLFCWEWLIQSAFVISLPCRYRLLGSELLFVMAVTAASYCTAVTLAFSLYFKSVSTCLLTPTSSMGPFLLFFPLII